MLRILRDLTYAGWTTERESIEHRGAARYYHRLTEIGIAEAKRALRGQYSGGTGLASLASLVGLSVDAVDLDRPGGR